MQGDGNQECNQNKRLAELNIDSRDIAMLTLRGIARFCTLLSTPETQTIRVPGSLPLTVHLLVTT